MGVPIGEGRLPARGATVGRLDLDDIQSQVAEQFSAQRTDRRGEIEDSVAGQQRMLIEQNQSLQAMIV